MIAFDVFTLFPEMFPPYLEASILQRARQAGLLEVRLHNIRHWAADRHHTTDDAPFGGGGGMVMKCEPVFAAVEEVLGSPPACPLVLLTPQGRTFTQQVATEWARLPRLGLLCGHYEGVDERIRRGLVTDEISIGDYVLTGGELPALILIDALTRLQAGALGAEGGAEDDSHATGLLEYPHYTRPAVFRGQPVPGVLLSGDHSQVARWRRQRSLLHTRQRRPDLLERFPLEEADRRFLENPPRSPDSLDWGEVTALAGQVIELRQGKRAQVAAVTPEGAAVLSGGKEHFVSRRSLEQALERLAQGFQLDTPAEYRALVSEEAPACAWGLLRRLGYIRA